MKRSVNTKILLITILLLALSVALLLPSGAVAGAATEATLSQVAGKALTAAEAEAIRTGFSVKAEALPAATAGEVTVARELLAYQAYGENVVAYNFALAQYFTVQGEVKTEYFNNDNFRKLGAPVTEKGTYHLSGRSTANPITEGDYTAQIFEKGILIVGESEIYTYVGAVEKTANGYILHPVIDDQDIMAKQADGSLAYFGNVDGEFHPLKDAEIVSAGQGADKTYTLYANYRGCCAKVVYEADYSIKSQYVYAARNFFPQGEGYVTAILPDGCFSVNQMICDGGSPVDGAALEYYRKSQPNGTEESLIALFADCYNGLLSDGFVAGYRCSTIKVWDLTVLDLRFGDGTTGFSDTGSGGRERMVCMVYNPTQNKVFPVRNEYFSIFKSDEGIGRKTLGYPESDILYDKTIGGVSFSELQIFQKGYIYKSAGGRYIGVTGYDYDAAANTFDPPITGPSVPDRYGDEMESKEKDGVIYKNYQKGAIECRLNVNGSKYYYTYYNGRNFDFSTSDYAPKLLPMAQLFAEDDLVAKGAMPSKNNQTVDFDEVIKPLLYQKYSALYNGGYFCGFTEEEFKGAWNGVFAQQFVVGDSSSMIFGEERPYVSALVYNPGTGGVYLMKDSVIKTWQGVYGTAGSPTSDEYKVDGCEFFFQTFDFGMTIRNGNLIVFTEDFASPQDYVAQLASSAVTLPTHEKDQAKGYIG